ncbi:MAG: hypothetical protein P8X43_09855, partial [Maritimibacter sp.]
MFRFDLDAVAVRPAHRTEAAALLASDADIWVTAGCTRPGEAPGYISPSRLRRLRDLGVAAVLTNDPAM